MMLRMDAEPARGWDLLEKAVDIALAAGQERPISPSRREDAVDGCKWEMPVLSALDKVAGKARGALRNGIRLKAFSY